MASFRHKKNIGDVLYSLPVVNHFGGRGTLYLDPCPDKSSDYTSIFLNSISFISDQGIPCKLWKGESVDIDLDGYVNTDRMKLRSRCDLVSEHFRGVGIEPPKDCYKPWLKASIVGDYPVLIHRTPRYRTNLSWNWLREVPNKFVVGFPGEVEEFISMGATYLPTSSLTDLANAVNSSRVVVGCQSVVIALAVGLGKVRILDDCDWFPSNDFVGPDHYMMSSNCHDNLEVIKSHI